MKKSSGLSIFRWFSSNKEDKKRNTASIAKLRLEAAISKDKKTRNIDFLPKMEQELIQVLEKYMEITSDDITCDLKEVNGEEVLDFSVNFHKKESA